MRHIERHRTHRISWLRAAVLGANVGVVSTSSLILGVAAAGASSKKFDHGCSGLVAGAVPMAAGEYVSVSSQSDTEDADLEWERKELANDPIHEHEEMAAIYVGRGLDPVLAPEMATQLMSHNALGAHAHDELRISEIMTARSVQAAVAQAATFTVGAASPLKIV